MENVRSSSWLLILILFLSTTISRLVIIADTDNEKKVYIVYMGGPPKDDFSLESVHLHILDKVLEGSKIIGARFYNADNDYTDEEEMSPRDTFGHGSHTASTAAGGEIENASLFGLANGTVRGAVPSARIAVYKVCWKSGCAEHDTMAAFDDAISDGVDILSVSLGIRAIRTFDRDVLSIGAFHAMQKGILTSVAAGNEGPSFHSITNAAPWMLTVAATSIDREFISTVTLGNNITIVGDALNSFPTQQEFFPFISASDAALHNNSGFERNQCSNFGSLNRTLVKGKIIFCGTTADGIEPFQAGAQGMVFFDDLDRSDVILSYPLPTATLFNTTDAKRIELYLKSSRNTTTAKIHKTESIQDLKAPKVASFSSRGPSDIAAAILKPDISAPGIDILAAWSPKGSFSTYDEDKRHPTYNIISGTSMACPHVTGAAAYVKTFHPTWSPAAIKSALMTTASSSVTTRAVDDSEVPAKELAYGAGQIDPIKAINPGLVYDTVEAEYIEMLCALGYHPEELKIISGKNITCEKNNTGTAAILNYPSMSDGVLENNSFERIFPRTVTNVGFPNSTYKATIGEEPQLNVTVTPSILSFKSLNEKQQFTVHVSGPAFTVVPWVVSTELIPQKGTLVRHLLATSYYGVGLTQLKEGSRDDNTQETIDFDSRFVYRKVSKIFLRQRYPVRVFPSNHALKDSVPTVVEVLGAEMVEGSEDGLRDLCLYEERRMQNEDSGVVESKLVCKTIYSWKEAISPHLAAKREGAVLDSLHRCLEFCSRDEGCDRKEEFVLLMIIDFNFISCDCCCGKIIGSRFDNADNSYTDEEERSLHDTFGHGSHTTFTAPGGEIENASLFGLVNGTVRGVVPSARITVYKVCWKSKCAEHDILAAFDDAISDGVDILSVSLAGAFSTTFDKDAILIGAFHVMQKGILTSVAAGTSMACPHAIGAAAYVKTFHPTRSPVAIKSALKTTALSSEFYVQAKELAYGAGQIDPIKAINPGLVYDTVEADYIEMLCVLGYHPEQIKIISGKNITCKKNSTGKPAILNYPSMSDGVLINKSFKGKFPRTVTNVGFPNSTYKATIGEEPQLNVTVTPSIQSFKSLNEKQQFKVHVSGPAFPAEAWVVSTELVWSDGFHKVRSSIVIWTYQIYEGRPKP
ncbi:hypothetical protein NE237_014883 [Protea cynaroides]|uniref:Uncharacterized protein n=1 Tax=Protea cynaroides TaxID=273540 RepID=A0A9Q0KD20_9MAGN|nr:hypothetical protein NE237_014883 [Protea cynaroides]